MIDSTPHYVFVVCVCPMHSVNVMCSLYFIFWRFLIYQHTKFYYLAQEEFARNVFFFFIFVFSSFCVVCSSITLFKVISRYRKSLAAYAKVKYVGGEEHYYYYYTLI